MNFEQWKSYFEHNASADFDDSVAGDSLEDDEKKCIARSIAAFQLGEYSEGRGLLRRARAFALRTGNPHVERITRLFIAEEQKHAIMLGRFMTTHQIAPLKKNWTDDVFRFLRKPAGFELSVTVLITAEIISLIYYRALRASTASIRLKRICTRILDEESMHVAYESQMLNEIRATHRSIARLAIKVIHTTLLLGTIGVVYYDHRSVLRRGGYGLVSFMAACWLEYSSCFLVPRREEVSARA